MTRKVRILSTLALFTAATAPMTAPGTAHAQVQAQCDGKTFSTYFTPGSSNVTAMQQWIKFVVTQMGAEGQVAVVGHIDRSEQAQANLDETRSQAVAKALVDNGAKQTQITTSAVGSTRPASQTPGGDSLNRRVEVCVKPRAAS